MSTHAELKDDLSALALGELDAERSAAVLEHVATCADCSATLELLSDIARIASQPRLLPARRDPSKARRWIWPVAAAAALLLAFVAGNAWLRSSGRVDLASLADRTVPTFVVAELRGAEVPLATAFAAAMESWGASDFAATERALTEFLDAHPDHAPARFYRGVARRELGDLAGARADLASVAETASGSLREHAGWCLAGVELLAGDAAAARRVLASVRASGGEFAARAAELERRIENPR